MHIPKKILFILFVLLLCLTGIWYSNVFAYLNLEWLQTHRDYVRYQVHEHYVYSVLCYIALYILITACSVPGAVLLSMLGGFLFNVLPAVVYILIGATMGASLAFLAARYVVGVWVQRTYQSSLRALNHVLKENGSYYLLCIRLAAIFPFSSVNLIAGLTRVPLSTFFWTTAFGIMPKSLVYSFVGKQLISLDSSRNSFSFHIVIAFFLLSLLFLIPLFMRKQRK